MPEQNNRRVVVRPHETGGARLLPARASAEEQIARIGDQTGGRVFLFLYTGHLQRDYDAFKAKSVVFLREPEEQSHGIVAGCSDLYGNAWDLIQPNENNRSWRL